MAKKIKIDEQEFKNILEALDSLKNGEFNYSFESEDENVNKVMKKISKISNQLEVMETSSFNMFNEITEGNLDFRMESHLFPNGFGNILESMNSMIDVPVAAIRDFNYAMRKLSLGDFDAKVSNNYLGEFQEIKTAFNSQTL